MAKADEEFTVLFHRAQSTDDPQAREQLYELAEGELRVLARSLRRSRSPDHILQTTLLVDEAFLRLVNGAERTETGRSEFFRLAHGAMRRILCDHRRRRRPGPLDAEQAKRTADARATPPERPLEEQEEMIAVCDAVRKLQRRDVEAAEVFMACFFHGLEARADRMEPNVLRDAPPKRLSSREVARRRGTSSATAHRSLRRAVEFLRGELLQHGIDGAAGS